jgi:hypothetical protein
LSPTALFPRPRTPRVRRPATSIPETARTGLKINHKRGETKAAWFVAAQVGNLSAQRSRASSSP